MLFIKEILKYRTGTKAKRKTRQFSVKNIDYYYMNIDFKK